MLPKVYKPGIVQNRRQAIIWNKDRLVYWCIYASHDFYELTRTDVLCCKYLQTFIQTLSMAAVNGHGPSGARNNQSCLMIYSATHVPSGVSFNVITLRWRHNDHAGVSNHQPHGCLLNRLFRRKSKKTSKLRVTGLCAGNSPGTGEFPAQMASYAENVSIWWRHHA